MAKAEKYKTVFLPNRIVEVEGVIKEFPQLPGVKFGFSKGSVVEVTHIITGRSVLTASTMKKAEQELIEILNDKEKLNFIKSCTETAEEYCKRYAARERKIKRLSEEFRQITGMTLPIEPITRSVDVIELDRRLDPPDGTSLSQAIEQKWGKRANKIVDMLIDCVS